jgi:CheY-like chemotaxis protein
MVNHTNRQPTILIVEDIEEIRFGMKRSLLDCGYRVLEATNADEAVEVAMRWPLDLILTEEELPTFALLLERASEHASLKGLPVVIVNPDAEEGMRYADAFVLTDYDQLKHFLLSPVKVSNQE